MINDREEINCLDCHDSVNQKPTYAGTCKEWTFPNGNPVVVMPEDKGKSRDEICQRYTMEYDEGFNMCQCGDGMFFN